MDYKMTVPQIKEAIRDKLAHTFGVSLENATDEEYYKASVLIVRELLTKGRSEFVQNAEKTGTKQIYYLCMEFLLGRSLRNNLYNLGLEEPFRKALADSLRMLNEAAPSDRVIALKSLEAFQKAADGKATKIIIPSEIQSLAGLATSVKELISDSGASRS